MYGLVSLTGVVAVALIFGGFYLWARRRGLLVTERAPGGTPGPRRISLLTEAVGYIGAVLVFAGAIAAVGQQWHHISDWGRVGVLAAIAAVFLLAGFLVRGIREPAIQRLADVMWFLSVAGAAGAAGFAAQASGISAAVTALAVGACITMYSAALWLARPHALENFALFTGLIVTTCSVIFTIDNSPPALPFALALWGLGILWIGLGWRRYAEPLWVTVPSGVILALFAPSIAAGQYGWLYAVGIVTAAAAMTASVRLRNTPLLALGSLAMFGYVTSVVVQYFRESIGVPGALAITGVLILGLAVVTARLMRAAHPAETGKPDTAAPPLVHMPRPREPGAGKPLEPGAGEPREPGAGNPPHRDLPRAS